MAMFVMLACSRPARAQELLVSDRPSFTETSQVVMPRRVVFEMGASATIDQDARTLSGPEFVMRLGLNSRFEFRLGMPDYRRTSGNGHVEGRLGETYVGTKVQLLRSESRFGLALIPGMTRPADDQATGHTAPELRVAWSSPGPRQLIVSGNIARRWLDGAHRGPDRSALSLTATRSLALGVDTFLEAVADVPDQGRSAVVLHDGFTLAIYPDGQVDAHLGFGLSSAAPDYFFGVGVTVRH